MSNDEKRRTLAREFQEALAAIEPDWPGRFLLLEFSPDQLVAGANPERVQIKEVSPSQLEKLSLFIGPRYAVVNRGMPDVVRAGEGDTTQPCPSCLHGCSLSLEHVHGRIRVVCDCGAAGAWAEDDDGANKNWDQLPRGVSDGGE